MVCLLTRPVLAGASVSSVFGSIILQNLAGFTPDQAVLLNMPSGALQFVSILAASYLAYRFKRKSPFLLGLVSIVIVGVALMVALPKTKENKGGLLAGYYLIAFVYAINPLLISWMGGNCAGQTKKAIYYTSFNAGNAIGNIITPYIFDSKFAPQYVSPLTSHLHPSIRKMLTKPPGQCSQGNLGHLDYPLGSCHCSDREYYLDPEEEGRSA
jgi:predicted MFS family arabinose efflux permease